MSVERPLVIKGRNADQIVYCGNKTTRSSSGEETIYWRCENQECNGKITTKGNNHEIRNQYEHL